MNTTDLYCLRERARVGDAALASLVAAAAIAHGASVLLPYGGDGRLAAHLPGVLPAGIGAGMRQTWCGFVAAMVAGPHDASGLRGSGLVHGVAFEDFRELWPDASVRWMTTGAPAPRRFDRVLLSYRIEPARASKELADARDFLAPQGAVVALVGADVRAAVQPWAVGSGGHWIDLAQEERGEGFDAVVVVPATARSAR